MKASKSIASFDSATGMLRAAADFLHGRDFPMLGTLPRSLVPVMYPLTSVVNALPVRARQNVYTISGAREGIKHSKLGEVSSEAITRWIAGHYPGRKYPAVMLGSSSGAAIHLCAALGIPWLPQTFLVPVRMVGVSPDDPERGMRAAEEPAHALLEANPDIQLHHMQDPVQDRLMLRLMAYFRVKLLSLGHEYEDFITDTLAPGGTIYLLECQKTWPVAQLGERYVFQFGAVGGATPEDYFHGGERVERYLEKHGTRKHWTPPRPDAVRPEAEWGFEPALTGSVEDLARKQGYRVRHVIYDEPQDLSPLVADLYRWWYGKRGLPGNRLVGETFISIAPTWVLRTGSVPFWMVFNTESSARCLSEYLDSSTPFDYVHTTLFSNGVRALGQASIEEWGQVLQRARLRGSFLGVSEKDYPSDFASLLRYYTDIRKLPVQHPLPEPLSLDQLEEFLEGRGDRYSIRWL